MCEVTYRVPGAQYQLWARWGILAKGNKGRQIIKRKQNHVSHLRIGIVGKCDFAPGIRFLRMIFPNMEKDFPNFLEEFS